MAAAAAALEAEAEDAVVGAAGEEEDGNALGPAFKVCYDIILGIGLLPHLESSLGAISLSLVGSTAEALDLSGSLETRHCTSSSSMYAFTYNAPDQF